MRLTTHPATGERGERDIETINAYAPPHTTLQVERGERVIEQSSVCFTTHQLRWRERET